MINDTVELASARLAALPLGASKSVNERIE
jgi:hypothetical protein